MKKILFVILEINSASGMCVLNVAEEMQRKGWVVDVLSYDLGEIKKEHINFYRIRPKFSLWMKKLCEDNLMIKSLFGYIYTIKVAMTTFMWPWNSPIFSYRLYREMYMLQLQNQYDCIVPVYTQVDALIAGYFLKRKFPYTKVVPYFLDSLSAGPRPRFLSNQDKIKRGLWWEEVLLRNMDKIIFMKSSERHHLQYSSNKDYFERAVFLDVPMLLLNEKEQMKDEQTERSESSLVLTYVGTLPLGIRNPEYAFKLISEVTNVDIVLNIVGVSEEEMKSINTYGVAVNFLGRMSHERAIEYLKKSDVLLNIGNKIEGMVPSKIFEYISYKKPILSFASIDNDTSIEYLEKYPYACTILEKEAYRDNINKVNNFLCNLPKCEISWQDLSDMYYKNTPNCFEGYISSMF